MSPRRRPAAALLLVGLLAGPATPNAASQTTGRASVYRDPWGVPHAYADREEDWFYGQSPDPASPHHSDLARLLSERRLKPTLFDKAAIPREQTSAVTLDFPRPARPD